MVRRHLGMSPEEWEQIPWWQQWMYVEGLTWEFASEEGSDGQVTDHKASATFSLEPGEMSAFGIREQTLG